MADKPYVALQTDIDPEYEWVHTKENRAEGLRSLLNTVMQADMRQHLSDNRRASIIWSKANGDRERAHTCGTFLAPGKGSSQDPCLIVYIDSGVLIADFKTNAELYLARLAMWGLALSGIDFRLSRNAGKKTSSTITRAEPSRDVSHDVPPLTAKDAAYIDSLVEGLSDEEPAKLKTHVRKTLEIFLRRDESRTKTG